MVENFTDLMGEIKSVDSRSSTNPKQENIKRAIHGHIKVELLRAKGKEKI